MQSHHRHDDGAAIKGLLLRRRINCLLSFSLCRLGYCICLRISERELKKVQKEAKTHLISRRDASASFKFPLKRVLFCCNHCLYHHHILRLINALSFMSSSNKNILGLASHESLEWSRRETLDSSRHRTDYEILEEIGRGAFGKVVKVRNKVDGHVYALKQVSDFTKNVLREVQVLSSIDHEHVVRYYGAWVEKGEEPNGSVDGSEEIWTTSAPSSGKDDNVVDPRCHLCEKSYRDWEVSFAEWGLIDSVLQPLDLCQDCYLKSIPKGVNVSDISIREKQVLKEYLFILMEFCDGTLQEAVQQCLDKQKWIYFKQCLQGLDYLHSNGIMHRDVKPNNIFIRDGVVKIGDLGLATATNTGFSSPTSSPKQTSSSKSFDVGTFLYTAPEVETGLYDNKCDVFSLGIVLVELFSNFGTAMERAETLDKLRRDCILPSEWRNRFPVQAALALRMVATDPFARPSCRELLLELSPFETKSMVQLEQELREKEATIEKLRKLLDSHQISHDHI